MNKLLSQIKSPKALRQLEPEQLSLLASEIRDFILDVISVKPGHLGASLGVVELSIAIHYYFNTPDDLLIWDVGHQSYPHKLLTGRQDIFDTLRQLNGISGFPTREESEYDAFGTGHSSTSISAITGMALANQLKNKSSKHVAVIGDASIVSGMAFEGLNHLGDTDLDVLIILNDNNIAIDPAVGALQKYFNNQKINSNAFFEALGFHYRGIEDGHNIEGLLNAFKALKKVSGPKILHISTIKGKGFEHAEKNQVLWHAPGKFNKSTGEIVASKKPFSFANAIGNILIDLFNKNPETVAITPAMPTGSGLVELMLKHPKRVWDVGIAEQHAVTLGAGLATQGLKPFVVIYSTFLQRAYDQLIHDVAIQNLPVVFLIDRAGISGSDGATHHGYFDMAYLNPIPNLTITAPANAKELQELIHLSVEAKNPWAIRYPKGAVKLTDDFFEPTKFGKAKTVKKGKDIAILSTGHIASEIHEAVQSLNVSWYHFPFVKPIDQNRVLEIFNDYKTILTYEEGVIKGGFGYAILDLAATNDYKGKIILHGYPEEFITHGTVEELSKALGLDADSIREEIELYL
ncbi:1-deoxy-D-xylulose-5-phosphate synthase [Flavobacteriaceae bacterium Ap0902]|nr:1-deoxy-D-xylulose-5-phosphate synthase [Flavobacteriaceae bacterium Ap0902]